MMTCQQHGWLTHQGGIIAVNIGLPLAIFLTGLPHQSWKLKTWVWDPWPWSSLRAFSPKRPAFFHFPVWYMDTTDAKFVILYYPTRIHKRQWPAVEKPWSICGPSIFCGQKSSTSSEQLPVGQAPETEGDFQEQPPQPQCLHARVVAKQLASPGLRYSNGEIDLILKHFEHAAFFWNILTFFFWFLGLMQF